MVLRQSILQVTGIHAPTPSSLSSRLPGYTGTNARDIRRALANPKGNLRLYVSLDELEDLLEASLAQYNASPHNGLNGRTPLEAVERSVRGRGAMLNWLPEAKRRTLCLMHTPHTSTVRGYLDQGQRPHVNFHGVRYTNTLLASTALLLGKKLLLYYNSQDLRTVRAFAADGAEIGVLKVEQVRSIIRELFIKRIVDAKGLKNAERFIDSILMPTPNNPWISRRGTMGSMAIFKVPWVGR